MPPLSPFYGKCHKCNQLGHRMADCRAGAFRFKCSCRNQFTSLCKGMNGSAPCHKCHEDVSPSFPVEGDGPRRSREKHNCDLCEGNMKRCPVYTLMEKEAKERKGAGRRS